MKNKKMVLIIMLLFLLCQSASADVVQLPLDFSGGMPAVKEGWLSEYEYEDESIHVKVETGEAYDSVYYAARVTIASPEQLRTVSAGGFEGNKTAPADVLARRVNAILAVNGDYYCYINNGYLVREGVLYRNLPPKLRDTLLIDTEGNFHIIKQATREAVDALLSEKTIVNSFNFGPALVVDGEVPRYFPDMDNNVHGKYQRCAIAQTGELEYLCVTIEGSEAGSKGITMENLAQLCKDLGAIQAYNLDGGDSSNMILNGERINAVNNRNKRSISDIIYFASAYTKSIEGENK